MRHDTVNRRARSGVTPRVKVWLECADAYVFGLGISEILEALDKTGSIKQAAAAVGKSYRHVWSRIKEAEAAFGQPLIRAQVGGTGTRRSFLTDAARELVAEFGQWRRGVIAFAEQDFARRFPAAVRSRRARR
jgi:molybdate transport system regulatory protein